jgi:FG-GAP-like repeat
MRTILKTLALCLLPTALSFSGFAQGTAFTYQGRLNDNGAPANGSFDLAFTLFNSESGGSAIAGPLTNSATPVSNGLFVVVLDFGPGVFNGASCWLDISLRTNGGAFTDLSPRQLLTPSPYAVFANAAGNLNGTLPAAQLTGVIANTNLPTSPTFPGAVTAGAFSGNGAALTALNASTLATGTVPLTQLSGITSNQLDPATWQLATNLNGGNAALASNVVSGIALSNAFLTNAFVTNSVFAGNGAGLTNLNASQLAGGVIPLAQLPAAVVTNGATGVNITGTFSGNGAAITNVSLLTANTFGAIAFTPNWGNFVFSSSPGGDVFPEAVVAADVNGDGKPDLISTDGSTLAVVTNNGSGGFVLSATYSVGPGISWVAAADVNGDGSIDLICPNFSTGTLLVLTNNGSGLFASNASYTVGTQPFFVVAADVNGDGKADLISADSGANTLTVLTNNGSGRFVLSGTYGVGSSPRSLVAADVNGDGHVDLISANFGANTLTVLTNNGSGGFSASATYTVGFEPQSVAAADVNGDGHVDLISANRESDTLTVLTNNGGGGFVTSGTYSLDAPTSVAAADVNGDGHVDLIVADYSLSALTVFTNNGSGGFVTSGVYSVGADPVSVVAADVNGDGHVDLISAGNEAYTLTVLFNAPASYNGDFIGNGSGLTALNASQLNGQIANSNLPANASFSGTVTAAAFSGNGSSLTGLNAGNLTSGTVPLAQLPAAVVTNNASSISLTGTFSGNGAGLTSLNASQLTSGTVPSARVSGTYSSAVAFNNTGNSFTGSMQLGGLGTAIGFLQAGQSIMPGSGTVETNFIVNYPQTFTTTPKIIVSLANDPGFENVSDTFAVSVSSNSVTAFRINVVRVDTATGWSQQLRVNWWAWQ